MRTLKHAEVRKILDKYIGKEDEDYRYADGAVFIRKGNAFHFFCTKLKIERYLEGQESLSEQDYALELLFGGGYAAWLRGE